MIPPYATEDSDDESLLSNQPCNVSEDENGRSRVILSEPAGSTAEVLLYGAQMVSWKNEIGEEMLFMSSTKITQQDGIFNICNWLPSFNKDTSTRGGIHLCFPQFSHFGTREQTGFVKNRLWSLESSSDSTVDLLLKSTDEDLKAWPYRFELRLHIALASGKITFIPRVKNMDNKSFSFTLALRNYLFVHDIRFVRIEGLEWLRYLDNVLKGELYTQESGSVSFDGEMDRVYLGLKNRIVITQRWYGNGQNRRIFEFRQGNMTDAVIWNPGEAAGKALSDLGDDEYTRMICFEYTVLENPVLLK